MSIGAARGSLSSGGIHLGGGVVRDEGGEFLRFRFEPSVLDAGSDVDSARRAFEARCEAYQRLAPTKLKVSAWLRVAQVVRGERLDVERVGHPLIEDRRPDAKKLERILACVYWGMVDARTAGLGAIGEISLWRVWDIGGKKNAVAFRMEPAFGYVRERDGDELGPPRADDRLRESSEADDVRSIGKFVFAVAANRPEVTGTDRLLRVPFPMKHRAWRMLSEEDERAEELWSRRRCEDLVVGLGNLRTLESIRERMPERPKGLKEPPAGPSPEDVATRNARRAAELEARQRTEHQAQEREAARAQREAKEREAQERTRRDREAKEREAKEREERERERKERESQERLARESALREAEAARLRDEAARQREREARDAERRARDEAARERAALEQADREHEERERRAKAAAAQERLERERNERATQEREAREREAREREVRKREAEERAHRQREERAGSKRGGAMAGPAVEDPSPGAARVEAGAGSAGAQGPSPSKKGVLIGVVGAVVIVGAAGAFFAFRGDGLPKSQPIATGPTGAGDGPADPVIDPPPGGDPTGPETPGNPRGQGGEVSESTGSDGVDHAQRPVPDADGRGGDGLASGNDAPGTDDSDSGNGSATTELTASAEQVETLAKVMEWASVQRVNVAEASGVAIGAFAEHAAVGAWWKKWTDWKNESRSADIALSDWVREAERIRDAFPDFGGTRGAPSDVEAQIEYNKLILASRNAGGGVARARAGNLLARLDPEKMSSASEGVREAVERSRETLRALLDRGGNQVRMLSFPGIERAGWQLVGQAGNEATFRHRASGLEVTYVRLSEGEAPVYMQKTEASIAQVSALLAASPGLAQSPGISAWAPLAERSGSRRGERFEAWEVRGGRIEPTRSIFIDDDVNTGESLSMAPDLFSSERPTADWPMQDISAMAAADVAQQAFGGRLPSVEEYNRALAIVGATGAEPPAWANLRSDGFFDQIRHAAGVRGAGAGQVRNPFYLDKFMTNWGNRSVPAGDAANGWQGRPPSDGATFFRPVQEGGGGPLSHVVGNVAEWADAGGGFRIVGASALSAPELGFRQPFDPPGIGLENLRGAFDVGFRVVIEGQWTLAGDPPASDGEIAQAIGAFPEWRD